MSSGDRHNGGDRPRNGNGNTNGNSNGNGNGKGRPHPDVPDPGVGPESTVPATGPAAAGAELIGVRRGMFGIRDTGDTSGYGRLVRPVLLPGSTLPPYGGYFDELVDTLTEALGGDGEGFAAAVEKVVVFRGELTLHIRREHIETVARALRDHPGLRFELCLGVSGVHYPEDTGRDLHAVYQLRSITHRRTLRLETCAPDTDPHIPSLFAVYPTCDWHERETYDFFGIVFDGHPSLTRIAMPDDWRGHPQRKDYPLGGIPVEYKGARIPPPDERRAYS
ncbi:MAG TPA: NADH-quinone oxidoreductase subunit C [Nocardia sp.]|uniref:NADH-quinone oxidoreductase subunit C n=1 Tax=Nocardia sp. TaxID=1821 RepID=UPI002B4B63B7|nr:NADH-quinone oxidoreductase subunit C [Nocardia sp.]HLS78642.1 NADH-quinone oxidoreductase subunit C [Nocardia sp.]